MRHVLLYGALWAITPEKFKWLLENITRGEGFQLSDYGELIGRIDADVSTMKPDQAQNVLDDYK